MAIIIAGFSLIAALTRLFFWLCLVGLLRCSYALAPPRKFFAELPPASLAQAQSWGVASLSGFALLTCLLMFDSAVIKINQPLKLLSIKLGLQMYLQHPSDIQDFVDRNPECKPEFKDLLKKADEILKKEEQFLKEHAKGSVARGTEGMQRFNLYCGNNGCSELFGTQCPSCEAIQKKSTLKEEWWEHLLECVPVEPDGMCETFLLRYSCGKKCVPFFARGKNQGYIRLENSA